MRRKQLRFGANHDFIIRVLGGRLDTELKFAGTGVIVAPDRVLTCKHVIMARFSDGTLTDRMHQHIGINVRDQTVVIDPKNIKLHSHFDLALLKVATPLLPEPPIFLRGICIEFKKSLLSANYYVKGYRATDKGRTLRGKSFNPLAPEFKEEVNALRTMEGLQLAGGTPEGNSGGPVFLERDSQLLCVGIIYLGGEKAATSRLYGADVVLDFLEVNGIQNLKLISASDCLTAALEREHESDDRRGSIKPVGQNPYRGLSYFGEEDKSVFFGRREVCKHLWSRFQSLHLPTCQKGTTRFMAVLGPSGCGKSSLVRAGLLPLIRRDPGAHCQQIMIAILRPSVRPIESLARALIELEASEGANTVSMGTLARQTAHMEALLRQRDHGQYSGLRRVAEEFFQRKTGLLIFVDQFEEVYGPDIDEKTREVFIENLLHAATDHVPHTSLLLTLRSDLLRATYGHARLSGLLSQQSLLVPAMTSDELREIIEVPAQQTGAPFEPSLIQLLLEQAQGQDGSLPLLEFALTRIWEGLVEGQTAIETLERIHGVGGALADRAQGLYEHLSSKQQAIARRVFLLLAQPDSDYEKGNDTRRRCQIRDLCRKGDTLEQVRDVLSKFSQSDTRLLMLSNDYVDVTHEALFEHWTTLKEWLAATREDRLFHRRLTDATIAWMDKRRDSGCVWRAPFLDELIAYKERTSVGFSDLEETFYAASLAQHQEEMRALAAHQRLRRVAVGVSASLLVLLLLGGAGFLVQRTRAAQRAEVAARVSLYEELGRQELLAGVPLRALVWLNHVYQAGDASPGLRLLLAQATHAFRAVRLLIDGHKAAVNSAEFSPDGKLILTSSYDETAKLWDAKSGMLRGSLKLGEMGVEPHCFARFSPDGKKVLTVNLTTAARLWDTGNSQLLYAIGDDEEPVYHAAFSQDSNYLVTVPQSHDGVSIWEVNTGKEVISLDIQKDSVSEAYFSPDGQRLVTIMINEGARLWDWRSGRVIASLLKQKGVSYAAFSPDSWLLATAEPFAPTIEVWDGWTGAHRLSLQGEGAVQALVFSPDGTRLSAAGTDTKARIWDPYSGELLATLSGHRDTVWALAFSPDGSLIVTGGADHSARVWDAKRGKLLDILAGHSKSVREVNFVPDGKAVITAGWDGEARVWDVKAGPLLASLDEQPGPINFAGFLSNDPKRLWTLTGKEHLSVWNAQTEMPDTLKLGDKFDQLESLHRTEWEINTRTQMTADGMFSAEIRNQKTHKIQSILRGHQNWVVTGDISPNEQQAVTASHDSTARIWDIRSGRCLHILGGHKGIVLNALYNGDGTRIATAGADGKAVVWDANTGQLIVSLENHHGSVLSAAFSPDNNFLATASDDARIWDLRTGQLRAILDGHTRELRTISFKPDGTQLVTGGGDGRAVVWEVELEQRTREELAALVRCHVPYRMEGRGLIPTDPSEKPVCSSSSVSPQAPAARLAPRRSEGRRLLLAGDVALGQRMMSRAYERYGEALAQMRAINDNRGMAHVIWGLAAAAEVKSNSAKDQEQLENALFMLKAALPDDKARASELVALADRSLNQLHVPKMALRALDLAEQLQADVTKPGLRRLEALFAAGRLTDVLSGTLSIGQRADGSSDEQTRIFALAWASALLLGREQDTKLFVNRLLATFSDLRSKADRSLAWNCTGVRYALVQMLTAQIKLSHPPAHTAIHKVRQVIDSLAFPSPQGMKDALQSQLTL